MSYFTTSCEECGRSVDLYDPTCSKCGNDFTLHPHVMPICPYCEKELHINDFFVITLSKKGQQRPRGSKTESCWHVDMWYCPLCGKILGFSNWASG
jgi:predicted amidophosphoribosyltransferase